MELILGEALELFSTTGRVLFFEPFFFPLNSIPFVTILRSLAVCAGTSFDPLIFDNLSPCLSPLFLKNLIAGGPIDQHRPRQALYGQKSNGNPPPPHPNDVL